MLSSLFQKCVLFTLVVCSEFKSLPYYSVVNQKFPHVRCIILINWSTELTVGRGVKFTIIIIIIIPVPQRFCGFLFKKSCVASIQQNLQSYILPQSHNSMNTHSQNIFKNVSVPLPRKLM